ncbi:uncharacterized protein LOC126846543 [Adelges cooleyi]|uniref:uncharacterized protein LOC126846543 n=1 Tax=Adelges cooleyi TaxID=133065 RepID=UPI00217FA70E|nr:uncharacterized protein LOC126846543 [Adelges cooleyi]
MYFKFIILLIKLVLIANSVLGAPPGLYPETIGNENIDGLYRLVKQWSRLPSYMNITFDHLIAFLDESHIFRTLANGYFVIDPSERLNRNNIDKTLFRILVRFICNGIKADPVLFTNLVASSMEFKLLDNEKAPNLTPRISRVNGKPDRDPLKNYKA